ncbi:hypothetical protein TVNIR_0601 [Thioalkalivibrio nitratireducens DSM 14787]|uniref:HmuY protein n=1 Tax=Thioalkalivibrio nitratireducens (strain DSM 14787 / UNIQEM 213 / ALEN2) TaxID=1255043 RepID=L0DTH7_THIND|nr:hypothetical protein TVNIR_0601 [Thioalkalivibrio nitratireducens DSM 14787]
MQIDATSSAEYVHLNLHTGQAVEVAAQSEVATEWHIAFRRFNVMLNGGTSGPGDVAGALVAAQDDFYDDNNTPITSRFTNATADSERPVLMAEIAEPGADDWIRDSVTTVLSGTSATDGGWYLYNPADGTMLPNPDRGWLLRSGEGNSYARMRMTELTFDTRSGRGVEHFRFEFDLQPAGVGQFTGQAAFEGLIPPGGGEVCFDFDADLIVACSGTDWDLKLGFLGRSFYLRSNGGVSGEGSGAAFGPFDWAQLATYTSATMDPGGTPLAGLYVPDSSSGVFSEHPWYAYNLAGQHRLWPNYRVYLVDTDRGDDAAPRYALQITGYYSDAGVSGHPRIRYRPVPATQ